MKIKHILPLILLLSLSMFAQPDKDKKDQVKALKISYITTELNLTSDESAKFWPIYNANEEKMFALRHDKMRPLLRKIEDQGTENISEKEANAYLAQMEDNDQEMVNLRKKLVADLKPVIGSVKVLKLKKAEDDFNKKLLSKYKGRKKN